MDVAGCWRGGHLQEDYTGDTEEYTKDGMCLETIVKAHHDLYLHCCRSRRAKILSRDISGWSVSQRCRSMRVEGSVYNTLLGSLISYMRHGQARLRQGGLLCVNEDNMVRGISP